MDQHGSSNKAYGSLCRRSFSVARGKLSGVTQNGSCMDYESDSIQCFDIRTTNLFFLKKDNADDETRCCSNITLLLQEGNHRKTIYIVYDRRINCSEELLIQKIIHICDMKRDFFFLKVSLSYKLAITSGAAIFTSIYKEEFLAAAETSMKSFICYY